MIIIIESGNVNMDLHQNVMGSSLTHTAAFHQVLFCLTKS